MSLSEHNKKIDVLKKRIAKLLDITSSNLPFA